MRRLNIYLILVGYCIFCSRVCAFEDDQSLSNWKTIAQSNWAQVLVEKKLYRKSNRKPFFVHACVKNKSAKTIAFDLSKRSLFYINQWCPNDEPQRNLIDETRLNEPIMTEQDTKYLIDIFNHKRAEVDNNRTITLVKLKPGKVFDYYISFTNGNYADAQKCNAPYIIIVMDGHMLFTDGKNLEIAERTTNDTEDAEVPIISGANSWSTIPNFAKIFQY